MFTNQQLEQLKQNGQLPDRDHMPVVKLHLPKSRCVWLLNEITAEDNNIAFGLCDLGFACPELGYVSLEELRELRLPLFDFAVEADPTFIPKYPMSVYADAARLQQQITFDDHILAQAAAARRNKPRPSPG